MFYCAKLRAKVNIFEFKVSGFENKFGIDAYCHQNPIRVEREKFNEFFDKPGCSENPSIYRKFVFLKSRRFI